MSGSKSGGFLHAYVETVNVEVTDGKTPHHLYPPGRKPRDQRHRNPARALNAALGTVAFAKRFVHGNHGARIEALLTRIARPAYPV